MLSVFPNFSNSLKSFWYLVPSSLNEMTPRTQHLFLFIGLVNGWIILTSTALAISWATTVLVFFSMIKQDSFYTRMESKLFIILCNVHFLETRGLFLESPRTFRAYFGCHNSLYIFATPRFSTIKLCNPLGFFFFNLILKAVPRIHFSKQVVYWFAEISWTGLKWRGPNLLLSKFIQKKVMSLLGCIDCYCNLLWCVVSVLADLRKLTFSL